MQEDIQTPQPYLRVYPDTAAVFAEPVERATRHLLPLVSIDLSAVNPDWHGWIHIVNPCEPADGVVGQVTQKYHSDYLRDNWLAFRLNAQNKYELLGDWRYFVLENPPGELPTEGDRAYLEEHYDQQHRTYALAKQKYHELGLLYYAAGYEKKNRDLSSEEPLSILDQLGGGAEWGNWCNTSMNPVPLDETDEDDIRPLTVDGRPFQFIASACGWHYCHSGADSILLFFEPESRTVLLTFDWT